MLSSICVSTESAAGALYQGWALALPKRLAEKFWALAPGLFWDAIGVRTCRIDKNNFSRILGMYLPLIQTRVANQSCHNRG
jgi:hypothetical protein